MNTELETLPVLPLRSGTLLPYAALPISVGRPRTQRAVEAALASEEKRILVVAMKNPEVEVPGPEDIYRVGTTGIINEMQRSPVPAMQLLITGEERAVIEDFVAEEKDHMVARVRPWPLRIEATDELEGLKRAVLGMAEQAARLAEPQTPVEVSEVIGRDAEVPKVVFFLASLFAVRSDRVQTILEAPDAKHALEMLKDLLAHEIAVLEIRNKIASRTASELSEQQREVILRQQLRAIQEELGETSGEEAELLLLERRIDDTSLPRTVEEDVRRELDRLKRLPSASQEHHVVRDRIELILELPWYETTAKEVSIREARRVLDEDHYGLQDVKERILEHLAVLRLNPTAKSPILCLVGAPGVGKTSVGRSVARAVGRRFERMSLGGLHDEAELRGHRRTYVGAMPGRIIRAIRSAGSKDPVLMLDEVDKLGRDFRGDPAAALLEVLDPEQNDTFHDNYLDLPFDLSQVFFVATANTLDSIPKPLLDRMEVLHLPGYTDQDKLVIAERFLVPRQLERGGLRDGQLDITSDAILELIGRYTREAGVRRLEQRIGSLVRKAALRIAEGRSEHLVIRARDLPEFLGPPQFVRERWRVSPPPGVAAGLAWTESGGDVLYVEATSLPERRGLVLTGHLGDVMKESAHAAHSYLWAAADAIGLDREKIEHTGVHVHVPAGATPKDGPSAGITIATAMASLLRGVPVRGDTAMTGEITLTGLVLPVGGIREKVLAAARLAVRRVILPKDNESDLEKIPPEVREKIEIVLVEKVEEVLRVALEGAHRQAA